MEIECLDYICKCQMLLFGIPTSLYENTKLLDKFEPAPANIDLTEHLLDRIINIENSFDVILTKELLMYGVIKDNSTELVAVIGPAHSAPITDTVARSIALSSNMKLDVVEEIKEYFATKKMISFEKFRLLICSINASINREAIPPYTVEFLNNIENKEISAIYKKLLEHSINEEPQPSAKRFSYNYEKQLTFYVKNGMVEKLNEHLLNHYKDNQGIVAFDAMRQYKNRCISMCTIISRAAIEGGVDPATCYELSDLYCQKVELRNSIPEINDIIGIMIHDFTNRVKPSITTKTSNPTIVRVIKYINENISQKIKVSDIAKLMHINSGYLSVKFKEETGLSLPAYITEQKIDEAKRLLKFTEKSVAEISNFLSFSSQSYFQNQFKKITGITPTEYRNKES